MIVSDAAHAWLRNLFSAIDAKNTSEFLEFLTKDASFRFGSAPAVKGHDAIRDAVDGFFGSIANSEHHEKKVLCDDATLVCEGEVTYRRHDGSELTVPFTDVFEMAGKLIRSYKIYIDISPLEAG
jgi:ketosteroid isomerase-like protein